MKTFEETEPLLTFVGTDKDKGLKPDEVTKNRTI
jgi:hypothetical protein